MSDRTLPYAKDRSWSEIERIAEAVLSDLAPDVLSTPAPVPVLDIVQFGIAEYRGVQLNVDELAPPLEGLTSFNEITNALELTLTASVFEQLEIGQGRARFTAAHELGHVFLHEPEIIKASREPRGLARTKAKHIQPYMNPERQADVFASRFLLPRRAVVAALQLLGPNVRALAEMFQVSPTAMRFRLGELGVPLNAEGPVLVRRSPSRDRRGDLV